MVDIGQLHKQKILKFTLDTNCLIDVEEDRDAAPFVKKLLCAVTEGRADVAMVASSASERQIDKSFMESLSKFDERRERLGFGQLELLPPLLRWDVGFWDNGLWASDETVAREALIYATMFPTSPPKWSDYAEAMQIDLNDNTSKQYFRWRNQLLDAQAFWAHEFHGRDVFVTSDKRFSVLEGACEFPSAVIRSPRESVLLL